MWMIVHFLSDNSVSAVPTTWLKRGYCAWPKPFIKNKNKFIENKIKPGKSQFDFIKQDHYLKNQLVSDLLII